MQHRAGVTAPASIAAALLCALACQSPPGTISSGGGGGASAGGGGATGIAGATGSGGYPASDGGAPSVDLLGAPLIFAPTHNGFDISVALRSGDPARLQARVREQGQATWTELGAPTSTPAADLAEWTVSGLRPDRRYEYEIYTDRPVYRSSVATARSPGTPFTFAMVSDTHIEPRDPIPPGIAVAGDDWGFDEATLLAVSGDIAKSHPDFVLNLGDTLDFHIFGFNRPPPDGTWTRLGYLDYRRMWSDTLGAVGHFPVIGNWDGETGCFTQEEIKRSLDQRLLYNPGPRPDTYPEGGGANRDYYAFTWGDALFIVLNVMTYTPTCHELAGNPGLPDDWTLGAAQLAWLERTLESATAKWRFTFIHHTVGGKAGNDDNSAYGRGGGQAARVGEQAIVHDLLLRYGVQIFFYGHDHVFTDMVVDGVHYTEPGSAGAPWKFTTSETGYTDYWPDSGHARVAVSPDRVQVDFVAMGGNVLTSYGIR